MRSLHFCFIFSYLIRCVHGKYVFRLNPSWFKEENEQLIPLQLSERISMASAGLLKITKVCCIFRLFLLDLNLCIFLWFHMNSYVNDWINELACAYCLYSFSKTKQNYNEIFIQTRTNNLIKFDASKIHTPDKKNENEKFLGKKFLDKIFCIPS